jgi:hypothetical protein
MSELTTQEKESSDDLEPISEVSPSKTLDEDRGHESSSDDNDETLGDDDAIDEADVVDPEALAAGANKNNDNNPTTNLKTLDTANANSIDFRNVTDNDNNIPVSGYFLFLFHFLILKPYGQSTMYKRDFFIRGEGLETFIFLLSY